MRLAEQAWTDLDDYFEAHSLALMPIGATEQHGPHLPEGTDAFIAETLQLDDTAESRSPPIADEQGSSPKTYRGWSASGRWPMPPRPGRRRFLRTLGATASAGLAGCAAVRDAGGRLTVTPAPVPSADSRPTSTESESGPSPPSDALELEVRARSGFDTTSPAELDISLRNAGETLLTALDGPRYTVPFVDDDYVGTDWTGDPELLLVPDDAEVRVDPAGSDPGLIGSYLPTSSPDGCWTVPFDWPAARGGRNAVLHAIPLQPGERRGHRYRVYSLEGCVTGTFSFVNTFDLAVGDPPLGRALYRARLGFDLALSETLAPVVRVYDPVIETRSADSPTTDSTG